MQFSTLLNIYLADLAAKGLYRERRVNSEGVINFSSNDYLSLANDPRIQKVYAEGFQRYPTGSGGSMVVCGYHHIHRELESTFALALGVDDCLLFSSGYAANLGILSLLGQLKIPVILDKNVHASIYDGVRLSKVNFSRYLHQNLIDLEHKLKQSQDNPVVITESVFSMSGQITPLNAISELTQVHGGTLFVDEAHGFGVFGHEGLGVAAQEKLTQNEVPLRIIPFGKTFAASGAIVAGQRQWIESLLQCARSYIYSTAMSPALAYGILRTFELIRKADERRAKLQHLVGYFQAHIKQSHQKWQNSSSPIQQLQLGCPHRAAQVAAHLQEQNIIALPMRQPTVSKQETGLRIILNYQHEPKHIDALFKALHQL